MHHPTSHASENLRFRIVRLTTRAERYQRAADVGLSLKYRNRAMDTPPATPLAGEWSPPDYLDIHYWDFAYKDKGPFRLYTADIGTTSAKTFAQ